MLIPKLISVPFAENGRKNEIPLDRDAGMAGQLASFNTGFPPITMQRKEDGGLPPDGMDFNGILYDLSAHAVYQNKGGQYKFNAEYAELIGGYPKGAILLSDDETKQYISVSENNKDNFNDASSAKWKVISLSDIDVLLNDKVSSQTMADALNLKLDKTTYATLTQRGITQLTNTIDDSEDKAVTPKAVMEFVNDSIPVGAVFEWDHEEAPKNYLFIRGQKFSAIEHPELAKLFPSLTLPDRRGVVSRGLDAGRGYDPGRALGSYQDDAMPRIYGSLVDMWVGRSTSASGAFSQTANLSGLEVQKGSGYLGWANSYDFDSLRSFDKAAAEVRMKNIATNFIIKAK